MSGIGDASEDVRTTRVTEIRMIGLAELHSKSGAVDHWKYYGELHDLKRRPMDADWLEAAVTWGAIGRIRPARITGYFRKLRDKRAKLDEADRFESFRDLIDAYLYPDRLTNHAFDRPTFAELDHAPVWDRVRAHICALTEAGYEVFLNSGTLLGIVRDGRLIDHDDDIDLALILKAANPQDAAREWIALRETLERLGLYDAENSDSARIHKLTPIGTTQIDLFPAWVEDGRVFVYPHTHGALDVEDVLPLRACPPSGHPLPARPERMLEVNYGAGWRRPDPLFKFPWTTANKAFEPFLKALEP